MDVDFNELERAADRLMSVGEFENAAEIYYFMADGDPSLDAGYLGYKLGVCYEGRGKLNAAKYWFSRALQENPGIVRYRDAHARLADVNIMNFLTQFR